jgi:hypothetical protein
MALGDVRGIPNQYILILGGEDHSTETTTASLGKSGKSAQTFAEYRSGGAKSLKMTVLQNFTANSVWTLANTASAIGTTVTGTFLPQGSAAGRPSFAVTATVSAPTSDEWVGGEGGEATADSPVVDVEWQLTSNGWAQSTL